MAATAQIESGQRVTGAPLGEALPQVGWSTILLIYALCVLGATSISQAIPVVGDIARLFHATREQAGWVISIPSAFVALGALAAGWLVDTKGDKPLLLLGCALLIAGDLGVVLASSLQMLFFARGVEGAGYVCMAVATVTMVTRITQGRRRTAALTLWSSCIPMSFAIPLLLAGLVAGNGHWRWAFLGHALLILILALAALTLPPPQRQSPLRRTTGLAAVLRSPAPFALGLAFACGAFVQTGVVSTLPQMLATRYGISVVLASSIGTLGMFANIAGCLSIGPLLNRGMSVMAIAIASVVMTLGIALTLCLAVLPFWAAVAAALLFFYWIGLIVGLWALLPAVAPDANSRGATSGVVTQLTLWGVLFGPPAAFAAQASSTQQAINYSAALLACLLLLIFAVRKVGSRIQLVTAAGGH